MAVAPRSAAAIALESRLTALTDRCVRCGLCLPHCPTYRLDRSEAESPRGRIALARALADGTLGADREAARHIDQCLGCLRCQSVCPAGVDYGTLLDTTRAVNRRRHGTRLRQRVVEWLCTRPRLLSLLLGGYRHFYRMLPAPLRRLPRPPALPKAESDPMTDPTATTVLFVGCLARRYEAPLRQAALAVLRAAGVTAAVPDGQTCCGALHRHAGDPDTADALAATNRTALAGRTLALTLASGCHADVAKGLGSNWHVQDLLVFLAERAGSIAWRPAVGRVVLHLPCTQRTVPGSVAATRRLLMALPGIDLIELPDTGCCGAAGSHMLDFPVRAAAFRKPIVEAVQRSGADTLLSANIGCRLHLDASTTITVMHPIEYLAQHLP